MQQQDVRGRAADRAAGEVVIILGGLDVQFDIEVAQRSHVDALRAELARAQAEVGLVGASPDVLAYVVDLARATRESASVKIGVSPRGSTALLSASKAWAWLTGFDRITPDHVQAMALPVLRHRLQLRPEAELEGVDADAVLRSVLQQVRVPI